MKKIIGLVILLQMFSSSGFAQGLSSYCQPMSKDPKCWQEPKFPVKNQMFCGDLKVCKRLVKISFFKNGHYFCEAGGMVECTNLVKAFGAKITGAPALVSYQQVDTCHVSGACGPKACIPSHRVGLASLSSACR